MKNIKLTSVVTSCMMTLVGIANFNTGWAKSTEDKVKEWVDDSAEFLKKGVHELGEDFQSIQESLDNYYWKGLVQEKAASGPATLKHLEMNDHFRAIVVKPGERIEAEVKCFIDPKQCDNFGMYRIVVGISGEGPQAVIGNELGLAAGTTREKFALIAPAREGIYQVRFRTVNAIFKGGARDAWEDEAGNEPDATTTIGLIVVKS